MLDYLYISDEKVDKLLLNMPQGLKERYALEFKVDLKLFAFVMKTATVADDELHRRVARLDAAVEYIREQTLVGTVDDPNTYIEDTLEMNWTPYSLTGSAINSTFVYFGGETPKTVVGLGGSVKHLLGHNKAAGPAQSLPAYLMHHLTGKNPSRKELLTSVVEATAQTKELIKRPVRFMAKQIASGEHEGRRVLVASPLYVAECE